MVRVDQIADLTGAVSIAVHPAKCGLPKLLLSSFRSSNHKLRKCETFPVRRIIPGPNQIGSRTFARTRRLSNNNSPFGSVLRWCNAVRPLWRTGPRRSAAVLALLVRKGANHVDTAASMVAVTAVANRAATVEAAGIVVANRVETTAATADAIVN